MNPELYFLLICVSVLVLFTLGLIFNVCISGSKWFKTYQYIMGTLTYSKEADTLCTRLLDKMDAGLLIAVLTNGTIKLFNAEDIKQTDEQSNYMHTLAAEAEIFIDCKYYSYGYIHRHFGQSKAELYKKRPSIKTFKRIVKLEEKLRGVVSENKKPETDEKNSVLELQ
ncbi:hypothetical protein [Klebsiella phage phiKp_21]|nr:putative membrane protein [Klebsiella phage Muenster]BEH88059.1 hypothetical protein [Klebsiella phage phiKp_21]